MTAAMPAPHPLWPLSFRSTSSRGLRRVPRFFGKAEPVILRAAATGGEARRPGRSWRSARTRGGEAFGAGSAHTGQRHSHHDVPHRAQHHSNDPLHTVLLSNLFKTRSVFRRVNTKR